MSEFLFQYYPVHPTTWVYLSSLLMIGLFFKFSRLWSVRNLDLVLLILLAPGLLMVCLGEERAKEYKEEAALRLAVDEPLAEEQSPGNAHVASDSGQSAAEPTEDTGGRAAEAASLTDAEKLALEEGSRHVRRTILVGYVWLFCVLGLLLLRTFLDPTMVRRPLLEPNLSIGGLAFIGCSLFVFLMANVISGTPTDDDLAGARSYEELIQGTDNSDLETNLHRRGPGNALLYSVPDLVTTPLHWKKVEGENVRDTRAAKAMAILSHLAVVVGIVLIGYWHFANLQTGIGAATLYLMLPYTSLMTGRVDHVLPAALLVWAVLCYRRPFAAGSFIGLAIGTMYYPLFLLPLWVSFYWQRGLTRFVAGILMMLGISVLLLVFVSSDAGELLANVQKLFGVWLPVRDGLSGIWGLGLDSWYRFPILAAFFALAGAFALWPAQKNLGTLLSCSGAIMIATQFWHGYGGGLYLAWFLPMLLLTIFRPNLEDRVALSVLGEGWFPKRRPRLHVDRAA